MLIFMTLIMMNAHSKPNEAMLMRKPNNEQRFNLGLNCSIF